MNNAYDTVMAIKKDSFSKTLYVATNDDESMVEYFGDVDCAKCGALCRDVNSFGWLSIPGMTTAELISIADKKVERYSLPELTYRDDEECCTKCEGDA